MRIIASGLVLTAVLLSQTKTDAPTRVMQSQAFKSARQSTATQPQTKTATKQTTPAAPRDDAYVGMNLWHMQLAEASSPVKIRGLKHKTEDPAGTKDWTPVRVPLAKTVPVGDHLRISLESARKGYLYVVDRDVYSNGQFGAPMLIFPTSAIRGGNNLVQPGRPIEIPDFSDRPNTFEVEKTRPDQTAIQLMILVTPQPLPEITIQRTEQTLREDLVAKWKMQWGSEVSLSEDVALSGKVYTMAEKNAAMGDPKLLGDADAVPLSLFHRAGHAGEPMLAEATIKLTAK